MQVPSALGHPLCDEQVTSGPQDVEVWRRDPSHIDNGYFVNDMNLDLRIIQIHLRVVKGHSLLNSSDWIEVETERYAVYEIPSGKKYIVRYYSNPGVYTKCDQGKRLVLMVDCGETVICPCCGSELG